MANCMFSGMLVRNGGSFEDDLSLGAEGGCGRIMTFSSEKRIMFSHLIFILKDSIFLLVQGSW